jgi:hypothetical protein
VQFNQQMTTNMLNGLAGFDAGRLNTVRNVTNLSDAWSPNQISSLIQTMNGNTAARQMADSISERLRQDGRITAGQRVIGLHDGTVYVIGGR